MAISVQGIAASLANVIRAETLLVQPLSDLKKKNSLKLVGEATDRKNLEFEDSEEIKTKNPQLAAMTKAMRAPAIGDSANVEDIKELFCMGHAGFVLNSAMSIEHGTAYDSICKNIEFFLNYLNSHEEIADLFLAEKDMQDFFGRDPNDKNKIKAKAYLYRVCYNQTTNLWLLCQSCNNNKGRKPGLEWFKSQKDFGISFVDGIRTANGIISVKEKNKKTGEEKTIETLRKGIIFECVPKKDVSRVIKIDEEFEICMGGVGIGEHAHDWFMSKRKDVYESYKKFKNDIVGQFAEKMDNIRELRDGGEDKKARKQSKDLMKKVDVGVAVMTAEFVQHDSSSDSETDSQRDIIRAVLQDNITKTSDIKHHIDKLENFISVRYEKDNESKGVIHEFFKQIFERSLKGSVPASDISSLRDKIEKDVGASKNLPDLAAVQEEINDSIKTFEEKIAKANEKTLEATRLLQEAEQRGREKDEEIMKLNQQLAASTAQEKSQNLGIKGTQAIQLSVLKSLSAEQHVFGTSINSDGTNDDKSFLPLSSSESKKRKEVPAPEQEEESTLPHTPKWQKAINTFFKPESNRK